MIARKRTLKGEHQVDARMDALVAVSSTFGKMEEEKKQKTYAIADAVLLGLNFSDMTVFLAPDFRFNRRGFIENSFSIEEVYEVATTLALANIPDGYTTFKRDGRTMTKYPYPALVVATTIANAVVAGLVSRGFLVLHNE